jgi:hypothetical protein
VFKCTKIEKSLPYGIVQLKPLSVCILDVEMIKLTLSILKFSYRNWMAENNLFSFSFTFINGTSALPLHECPIMKNLRFVLLSMYYLLVAQGLSLHDLILKDLIFVPLF